MNKKNRITSLSGKHKSLLVLPLYAVLVTSAPAAVIAWGAATNVNGISDISNNGTALRALNIGTTNDYTINGVLFDGNNDSSMTYNVSTGVGGLGSGGPFTGYGTPLNNANGVIDASYGTALSSGRYVNGLGSIGTYTLTGLVENKTYEIQLWFNDVRTNLTGDIAPVQRYDSGASTAFVDLRSDDDGLDGAGGRGALAQFVTATFTADASGSQTFRIDETSGIGGATINMFQIRDVTVVPEPSVALLGGIGLLALLRRRHR